jgi:hypothetical protein
VGELPIVPGRDAGRVQSAPVSAAAPAKAESRETPPIAFRALLERLRDQALTLQRTAEEPLSAQALSGAVSDAQASLHDALSIADGLVEAYRSSRVSGPTA